MIGFLIGTACLIGLVKVLRHGGGCGGGYGPPWARGGYGYRRGGGCGGGGCGGGYREGYGGGDGPEGWGGHHGHGHEHGNGRGHGWGGGRGFWGGGSGFFLRMLFERLDTTPGQEKVIKAAVAELRDAGSKMRDEVKQSRSEVAKAVRSPSFDAVLLGEMFAKQDTAIEAFRKAGIGAVGQVHEALDEKQREQLADLIEHGPAAFRSWRPRQTQDA